MDGSRDKTMGELYAGAYDPPQQAKRGMGEDTTPFTEFSDEDLELLAEGLDFFRGDYEGTSDLPPEKLQRLVALRMRLAQYLEA